MQTPRLIQAHEALLLVIDMQDRFIPVLHDVERVLTRQKQLIEGCNLLNVPVLVSEHYPKGLGSTDQGLLDVLERQKPPAVVEKTHFGCCGEPGFMDTLKGFDRTQVLVCGIEAHVCVNQTVIGLLAAGYEVFLVEDAITARNPAHTELAIGKLTALGAVPCNVEMALFELMVEAKHPQFKAVQALIK
ncbi:MAG: isochorismatase family protein [Vampirovibrionales bacterium]